MGHMRRREELQTVTAGAKNLAVRQRARRPFGEIVDHHLGADDAAHRLGLRRRLEPLIEGTAFVGLEMAEADPAKRRRLDHGCHRFERRRKHLPHAGVHQKRLIVLDEKLVELNTELSMKRGQPINSRRNLGHCALHIQVPFEARSIPGLTVTID